MFTEQRINWREITINSLREVATKQMASTSGREGCGGALTTTAAEWISSLTQGIVKETVNC